MRDGTIEPAESMNELCAGLDPAMHFGGALVILEARTPGRSALRHPQIEKIVSCVHVPGQSASLLDRFRPYTDTSLSFRRTLSAGWGGFAGWAHGGGSTGVAHKTEKPADKRAVGGCDRSRIPPTRSLSGRPDGFRLVRQEHLPDHRALPHRDRPDCRSIDPQ